MVSVVEFDDFGNLRIVPSSVQENRDVEQKFVCGRKMEGSEGCQIVMTKSATHTQVRRVA